MLQLNALFTVIFNTVAPIFLIIGATLLLGRYRTLDGRTLSRIAIYLFSPALILTNISQSGLGADELSNILLAAMAGSLEATYEREKGGTAVCTL